MAHFAGLVAAGLHPSPVPYAHVVNSTVHKTLAGPRSGFILANEELAKKINSNVFPGQQGGPLMHVIAAKAIAFKIAASQSSRSARSAPARRPDHRRAPQRSPTSTEAGVYVLTGGTDVHLVLVDLRNSQLDGQQAEDLLHSVGITVNRNAVPFDPRPPMVTSGLRIGTPGAGHPRLRRRGVHRGRRHHRAALKAGPPTSRRSARVTSSPPTSRCTRRSLEADPATLERELE